MTEEDKKKPCGKTISLQEAIDAMQALQDEDVEAYGVLIPECFDSERAIEALKQLKPVRLTKKAEQESKTGWIPVNERLPEEDVQSVLFCDIDEEIMIGYHVKGRPRTHFSQDGTYEDIKNVKAWQPLPEPYKPESEDEECRTN